VTIGKAKSEMMKRSELLSLSLIEWLEGIALDTVLVYTFLLVSSLNNVCV
jgi:tetrahydromethanopterin S-methyltransferase subunit C